MRLWKHVWQPLVCEHQFPCDVCYVISLLQQLDYVKNHKCFFPLQIFLLKCIMDVTNSFKWKLWLKIVTPSPTYIRQTWIYVLNVPYYNTSYQKLINRLVLQGEFLNFQQHLCKEQNQHVILGLQQQNWRQTCKIKYWCKFSTSFTIRDILHFFLCWKKGLF